MSKSPPTQSHQERRPRQQAVIGLVVVFISAIICTIIFSFLPSNQLNPPPSIQETQVSNAATQNAQGSTDDTTAVAAAEIEISNLPVTIVNISGEIIGRGTLYIYAPRSLQAGQAGTIQLELQLNERSATPTPIVDSTQESESGDEPTPPSVIIATAFPTQPSTPRATPINLGETSTIDIYQRMGASLLCDAIIFSGCDDSADPVDVRLFATDRLSWSWSWRVRALENSRGEQPLSIEVWRLLQANNRPEQPDTLWRFDFTISIQAPVGTNGETDSIPALIFIVVIALLVVGLMAYVFMRGRQTEIPGISQTAKPGSPAPKIFISYRRKVSWIAARGIHDTLTGRGADVFLDVDDINEGRFEDIIKESIDRCDYFIPVLAPGTLDSEWVVKEIMYALEQDKRIIPVQINDFKLDSGVLPPELSKLGSHNAVTLVPEFYQAGIERIAEFVGLGNK